MGKRKIQLWRFVDEDGDPAPPIPAAALHRFLLACDAAGDDLTRDHGGGFRSQLEPAPGSHPHLLLHRLRDNDLPSERRRGRIVALNRNVLELAEGSHALLLPRNLLAFVGSGFSPRPGRLAEWMRARLEWDVWLEPVLREDLGTVLDHLEKVSNIELGIRADEVSRLDMSGFFEDEDDPLRVLLAAQRANQGGVINVRWSVGQGSGADQGFFRNVIDRLRRADVKDFTKAKADVYVEDDDAQIPVDFIHSRVVASVDLDDEPQRQRTLDVATAYNAMKDAWDYFRDDEGILDTIEESTAPARKVPRSLVPEDEQ